MAKRLRVSPKYVKDDDREFIELARKRFKQANDADTEQRERELADLKFYAGDQWPEDIASSRKGTPANTQAGIPPITARPTLVINKVREPVRQVLNQERQADELAMIYTPDELVQYPHLRWRHFALANVCAVGEVTVRNCP